MKIQFLNSITLEVISGGNIYNKTIIEGLERQGAVIDYNRLPLNKNYDTTIVDSLFMSVASADNFKTSTAIIALIHQIPELDSNTINFYRAKAKFIVTGQPTKQKLIKDWQISDKNIRIIRPGLPDFWSTKKIFSDQPKHIILVANFVQGKGFELLIKILEHLRMSDLKFSIIGNNTLDKTYAKTIIKAIKKTNTTVNFYFNISTDNVHSLLMKADIFLSLSKSETFGMAIFEALHIGLPCVAYKTGDFEYFKQYSNFVEIEDYSENAFIEVIEELIKNKKSYKLNSGGISQNKRSWREVTNEFSAYVINNTIIW